MPAAVSTTGYAGEFYSWSDASGMTVLTDNPGRIPADRRIAVAVYSFPDRPASHERSSQRARVEDPIEASAEEIWGEPDPMPARYRAAQGVKPINPTELGLPAVLLEAPDDAVQPHYVWVPFTVPVYLAGSAVSGFWWHAGGVPPIQAFKQFLAESDALARTLTAVLGGPQRHGDMVYHRSLAPLPRTSGNPVFDQILREQQAMIARMHARPSMPAHAAAFHPGPRAQARSGFRR
jgi:hypothetical protein